MVDVDLDGHRDDRPGGDGERKRHAVPVERVAPARGCVEDGPCIDERGGQEQEGHDRRDARVPGQQEEHAGPEGGPGRGAPEPPSPGRRVRRVVGPAPGHDDRDRGRSEHRDQQPELVRVEGRGVGERGLDEAREGDDADRDQRHDRQVLRRKLGPVALGPRGEHGGSPGRLDGGNLEQPEDQEEAGEHEDAEPDRKEQPEHEPDEHRRTGGSEPPPLAVAAGRDAGRAPAPALGDRVLVDLGEADAALVDDESEQRRRSQPEREACGVAGVADEPGADAVDRLAARVADHDEHEREQDDADQVHAVPLDELPELRSEAPVRRLGERGHRHDEDPEEREGADVECERVLQRRRVRPVVGERAEHAGDGLEGEGGARRDAADPVELAPPLRERVGPLSDGLDALHHSREVRGERGSQQRDRHQPGRGVRDIPRAVGQLLLVGAGGPSARVGRAHRLIEPPGEHQEEDAEHPEAPAPRASPEERQHAHLPWSISR